MCTIAIKKIHGSRNNQKKQKPTKILHIGKCVKYCIATLFLF